MRDNPMSIQFDNDENRQDHAEMIHALSERYHVDESTIRELYESKLAELRFNASITAFLPVLIERYVKTRIHITRD
jgi:hypothetical protein